MGTVLVSRPGWTPPPPHRPQHRYSPYARQPQTPDSVSRRTHIVPPPGSFDGRPLPDGLPAAPSPDSPEALSGDAKPWTFFPFPAAFSLTTSANRVFRLSLYCAIERASTACCCRMASIWVSRDCRSDCAFFALRVSDCLGAVLTKRPVHVGRKRGREHRAQRASRRGRSSLGDTSFRLAIQRI